jgi:uncharacterized membrane protein (UPF0127 family)
MCVARAVGLRARALGLTGLSHLPRDRALHIPRCRAVHTIGMRFTLDLVWLDGHGGIVRVDEDVRPRRHAACRRARSVVELRAGEGRRFAAGQAAQTSS